MHVVDLMTHACSQHAFLVQEVLSDLDHIVAAAVAEGEGGSTAGPGSQVAEGALSAAVHLLQWDEQVVRAF